MNIPQEIQKCEDEIKNLKKGIFFWAHKISPKMKKRRVKVNFLYKQDFIKKEKAKLQIKIQTLKQCQKEFIEMIERFFEVDNINSIQEKYEPDDNELFCEVLKKEILKELGVEK
jgi:hypothetical protein